jgi:hypothetical protein
MTTSLLSPQVPVTTEGLPVQRDGAEIQRPPTVFGKESPWELVVAGHHVARRASGLALDQVGIDDATDALVRSASRDELRMAFHMLAWTRFDVPLSDQVNALFLVEDTLNAKERVHHGRSLATIAAKVGDWLRGVRDRLSSGLRPGAASPSGHAPAC